ncbi:MAG TPA: hypothetical protein VK278_01405 [Gaiellaceae bacterium]|nr:hypothetical protein [Gaiellaceae bacterium]
MKLRPLAVFGLWREFRTGAGDRRPLAVAGAPALVPLLARELRAGGDPSAVVEGGDPRASAALVWVGEPDEKALRAAVRADVPVIAVSEASRMPYVLDTRLVRVRAGEGFPVDRIARALAGALGEDGTALAARLPVVRDAVVDELIRSFSRKNGIVGVAVFIPGVDMPLMTMNQIRLVLRIALAYGESMDASRAGELLGVIGAGFGLRAVARQTLGAVPVAGWAVKGGIGYTGTKAIGEAARRYFETRST